MSPLSDWRLPFSGFSSLSLQNKERPFQKSGFHLPGGKLPSGWEGKQQEGGVRDTRGRNSEDDLTWESCPGAPPHTWTSPHRILSLFQQFFWLTGNYQYPSIWFFFPFLLRADRTHRKGRGQKRECWKGFQGSVQPSGLMSSVQHLTERDTFHFTEQWTTFREYLFNFPSEVGGWSDITSVGHIPLLWEHLFEFKHLIKVLSPFFLLLFYFTGLYITGVCLC